MAHKGKVYPVLFRRDWNLNLDSNRFGWANRYVVKIKGQGTGIGTILFDTTWSLGPGTLGPIDTHTWNDAQLQRGPFIFKVSLVAEIGSAGTFFDKRLEIEELHFGQIAVVQLSQPGDSVPGFSQSPRDFTAFWDPGWWDSYPFLELSTYRPKVWADGPPH